ELLLAESPADEAHLDRRLLAALGEVRLVEGEAKLPVFEDEVLSGVVVSAARGIHDEDAGVCAPGVGIIRRVPALPAAVHGILHAFRHLESETPPVTSWRQARRRRRDWPAPAPASFRLEPSIPCADGPALPARTAPRARHERAVLD